MPLDLQLYALEDRAGGMAWTQEDMLREVHGGRKLHWGARRTWQALNKRFPGHAISFRAVEDWISKCAICQKDRLGMDTYVEPVYHHLKKEHNRRAVGVDLLTVTPVDEAGNTCLIVLLCSILSMFGQHPRRSTRLTPWPPRCSISFARLVFMMSCGRTPGLTLWLKSFRSLRSRWASGGLSH